MIPLQIGSFVGAIRYAQTVAVVPIHEATSSRDCATPGCTGEADGSGLCRHCLAAAAAAASKPPVRFEPCGLVLASDVSDDQLRELLGKIARMEGALRWALGDLLSHFDRRFWKRDELLMALLDEAGLSWKTARDALTVARAIPREQRRPRLSWTHHRLVAELPPEQQEHWLRRAELERLTVSKLDSAIRAVALVEKGEPLVELEQTTLRVTAPAASLARWKEAAAERGCSLAQLVVEALEALTVATGARRS